MYRARPRILILTTSYPADEHDPSGHFVRAGARALARAGSEVHVIAPGGSLLDAPRRDASPTGGELWVHSAGGGALFGWPGAAARARERPLRLLAALPFAAGVAARRASIGAVDRAIAHWIVPSGFPLLDAVRAPLEVVGHGADVRLLCALPAPVRARIVRRLLDRDARFTFAAQASLDALARALPSPLASRLAAAAIVEPPAIELPPVTERARALRASLGLPPGERLAVVVGRLVAGKRVELAIEAAAAAGVPIVVVGGGPEGQRLEALARSVGCRARFLGVVPRDEALAWIACADVLVHASAAEAAPTVVREARALGVPVLACPSGDVVAWSARDPGITLVRPSAEGLSAALRRL
ncbi:glycosyltransferase [Polyangium aurulentum]|uniref:glycosyltransferase n=1 Tax=Polyangium aurulentum TaxID=2567896 RepID=UPI0010ADC922|nr:glycosyltransferase [Polyangium aurulentum]UQA55193.1 glycosyltransferase [Polyangium aurulentum]